VEGSPWEILQPHIGVILQLLLTKLQQAKALRTARRFVQFAALIAGTAGAERLEAALNAVSPGVFASVLDNVISATANKVRSTPVQ
jgi:hypothetical protein